jgi:hypothetical protein
MPFAIHAMLAYWWKNNQIANEDTQKLLWQGEETCLLGNDRNKVLPSLELPLLQPPHKNEPHVIPSLLEWSC